MSDNVAVSWSEYHAMKTNAEIEVRQKISQELLEHMRFLQMDGAPECYLQGMERARTFILYNTSISNNIDDDYLQQWLF